MNGEDIEGLGGGGGEEQGRNSSWSKFECQVFLFIMRLPKAEVTRWILNCTKEAYLLRSSQMHQMWQWQGNNSKHVTKATTEFFRAWQKRRLDLTVTSLIHSNWTKHKFHGEKQGVNLTIKAEVPTMLTRKSYQAEKKRKRHKTNKLYFTIKTVCNCPQSHPLVLYWLTPLWLMIL